MNAAYDLLQIQSGSDARNMANIEQDPVKAVRWWVTFIRANPAHCAMPYRDVIVIGTSTGGIEATKMLATDLPPDFKASLFIVRHIGPNAPGILPQILGKAGCLPATNAKDGEMYEPGHIYVAPPDHHLLLERPRHLRVTRGPKENRSRPAVDPLFRSAAYAFGSRVIGVILTGELDDGTAGMWSIKARGGSAIVQNPEEAIAPSMPLSALKQVSIDHCMRLEEIAPLLVKLSRTPVEEKEALPMPEQMETEVTWRNTWRRFSTDAVGAD